MINLIASLVRLTIKGVLKLVVVLVSICLFAGLWAWFGVLSLILLFALIDAYVCALDYIDDSFSGAKS